MSGAALVGMTSAGGMMMIALTMTTMTKPMVRMPAWSMMGTLRPAWRRMRRISTPTAAQGPAEARSALLTMLHSALACDNRL